MAVQILCGTVHHNVKSPVCWPALDQALSRCRCLRLKQAVVKKMTEKELICPVQSMHGKAGAANAYLKMTGLANLQQYVAQS